MSSEDHIRTQRDSDYEDTNREDQYVGPKADDDEGYHTPTSEEHRIPPAVYSLPPPPPRKRKLLVFKNMKKVEGFKGKVFLDYDSDIESFFKALAGKSAPPPPVPEADADRSSSPKKRHVDK